MKNISIIIPAYNEEEIIKKTLDNLKNYLTQKTIDFEIIVVNDGSSDDTKNILENIDFIKIVNHPYNKGYGASLKTGVKNSQYDWVLFYDGDGQHKPEYIHELIKHSEKYDMIIGSRTGYKGPWIRQPGKLILKKLASYLVDYKIPDLNSGFRLIKKDKFNDFLHLYPDKFSLTTTITLAFIKASYNVKYIPIKIEKRAGKSTVKARHAIDTFVLIIRIITLFSPLRFFFPVSVLFAIASLSSLGYDTSNKNITDSTLILIISSFLIFFFGVIMDQISALRRGLKK